jgi:transcriptional regulator with XRE-family HTH domain
MYLAVRIGGSLKPETVHLPGLSSARKKAGLTQGELMARAGVKSRTTISRIENGYPAEIDTARRLAKALEVSRKNLERGPVVPVSGKTPVDLLEDRLARYQERGEKRETKWGDLHGKALIALDLTENRRQRKRLKEVARRAYDGMLEAFGIDPNEPDAIQAFAEVLRDHEKEEEKEALGAA